MSSEIMSASDRLDIIDVINRLFIATDSRDWETVKQCFTDPVTIDMSSVGAGAAREMKPAEIAGMWETGLSRLKGIHHQAGNYVVTMEGNGATVFCYGIALHYLPNPSGRNTRTFVGSYDFQLSRDRGPWEISKMRFNLKWLDGNPDLESS
ncbi:MAG TPA: nuclear transport factor 2 family protein [Candidatus Krumholzibacteria bacterium]|nr:nuclear transport factor 2 family protein [Candidatus Krumholzibacteria bacterium]